MICDDDDLREVLAERVDDDDIPQPPWSSKLSAIDYFRMWIRCLVEDYTPFGGE